MSNSLIYSISVLAIATLVTWLTRALPFLVFGKRELPPIVTYLGRVLPPAIMMILVVYCLRNTAFAEAPYGIPEIISCLLVFLVHILRKNMYISIIAGTVCYMVLIRMLS